MEIYTTLNKIIDYEITEREVNWILSLSEEDIKTFLKNNIKYNDELNFRDLLYLCHEKNMFINPVNGLSKYYNYLMNVIEMNRIYQKLKTSPLNYQINEEFIREVYKDMKQYPTKLEQAAYLYFKLCFLLRQDIPYALIIFICQGFILEFNKDIKYLENINVSDNQACCFDFAAIFNWFLNQLGLLTIDVIDDKYGTANHVCSKFYCDGVLFSFDPWLLVEQTDLYNLKINNNFNGIEILSGATLNQKEEYFKILKEVFDDVLKEVQEKSIPTFSLENKFMFISIIDSYINSKDKENLKLYILKFLDTHLKGEELKKYVHMEISSKINKTFKNFKMTTVCNTKSYIYTYVLTIKTNDDYKYILFEDNGQITCVSKDDLLKLILEGTIMIGEDLYYIPGIDESLQFQSKQSFEREVVDDILEKVKTQEIYGIKLNKEIDIVRKRRKISNQE